MRLIDADALKDRFQNLAYDDWNQGTCTSWADAFLECADMVDEQPTIEPERKTGRWIESNPQNSKLCRLMTCSECGKAYIVNINVPYEDWTEAHKFCVECGAKMKDGEQDG